MKYDELLEILRECNDCRCEEHCPYHEERNNPLRCMTKIVGDAADAIEELQQIAGHYEESAHDYFKDVCYYLERMPKWIPVSERLPNGESDRYLVAYDFMSHLRVTICYYADNLEKVCKYDFAGRTDNGFYAYDDEYGFYEKTDVRYWMPLPEPPKEET